MAGRDCPWHRRWAIRGPVNRFSLYIHIPYCDSKCPYCDFNSYVERQLPEREYRTALLSELTYYAQCAPWRDGLLQTVYLGGGTPSLFTAESIADILAGVCRLWPRRAADVEVTLEANPGTVSLEKLRGLIGAGVTRISFGVQSFQPRHLIRLGRIHSAGEAINACELARQAGVAKLNLDLLFAVPEQTLAEWESDLRTAIRLDPDHVSAYGLTFEKGTAFEAERRSGALKPLPEEIEAAMFSQTQEVLAAAGYRHYEISNYALPGCECRHNLNYWHGGEYLGIGAGAHSFARTPAAGSRWSNEEIPDRYIAQVKSAGHAHVFGEMLTEEQARGEFVFLNLRCRDGFSGADFAERFRVDFPTAFAHVGTLVREGLLEPAEGRWRLTDRGLLHADTVFATFV